MHIVIVQTLYTMIAALPNHINDIIADFAGVNMFWKLRFSNDVLPCIEKGYRAVHIICGDYIDEEDYPCANCYSYGMEVCLHGLDEGWDMVSYDEIKPFHRILSVYKHMPYQVFNYMNPTNVGAHNKKFRKAFSEFSKLYK